ncbi:MAG: hypothetical protein ACR2H4_02675 [Pyrinomonadaceae bacterium]
MKEEDEICRQKVVSRGLAIIAGLVTFFALPIALGHWLGYDWRLMTPTQILARGIIGLFFGFRWPEGGWRLGFYLFASWPPILMFALFLGGEYITRESMSQDLMELLNMFLMFVAACFGAGSGAFIRRRRSTHVSAQA